MAEDKQDAVEAMDRALLYCLRPEGAHITKKNKKKTVPINRIIWSIYKALWPEMKQMVNSIEFWHICDQLIRSRDELNAAKTPDEKLAARRLCNTYKNVAKMYLRYGVREPEWITLP